MNICDDLKAVSVYLDSLLDGEYYHDNILLIHTVGI